LGKKVENFFEKITNPMWKLKQSLNFSLVHKSVRTGRPLEIDWIKNEKWKQKTPRVVIRAVVNKKIVPIYDPLSQVLDELHKIWNMFWKPLDDCSKMITSLDQKNYQNTSKIGPKVKKSTSRNYFFRFFSIFEDISQLLDELHKIWNMFWKALDDFFNMN